MGVGQKLCTLLILSAMLAFSSFGAENIAVLEIGGSISDEESSILTDKIINVLISTHNYSVIERSMMKEILKEQAFQMSGCTNNECAVEVGQILGVSKMVTGTVGKIGSLYSISLRLVDVATGKIEQTAAIEVKGSLEDVLVKGIPDAVQGLTEGMGTRTNVENSTEEKNKDSNKKKKIGTIITATGAGLSAGATVVFLVQMNSNKSKYDELTEGSTEFDKYFDAALLNRNISFVTGGVTVGLSTAAIIIGTRKVKTSKGNEVSFAPTVLPGYGSLTFTYNF